MGAVCLKFCHDDPDELRRPVMSLGEDRRSLVKDIWGYPYDRDCWVNCCDHAPGNAQSPIDLPSSMDKLSFSFKFQPQYTNVTIHFGIAGYPQNLMNNGHTILMNVALGQTLTVSGTVYDLLQFHFHTTSEHTVDHRQYGLEMHLVHQIRNGTDLLVLGIFFDPCDGNEKANDFLASFWDYLPGRGCKNSDIDVQVPLSALATAIAGSSFYNYDGSLTTPPLSEGVTWLVAQEPLRCTKAQIQHFSQRSGQEGNYRPPQPLNNRKIRRAEMA